MVLTNAYQKSSRCSSNACLEVGVFEKSSYSGSGSSNCLEAGVWTVSSRSSEGNCVAATYDHRVVRVRDSKNPDAGTLEFEPAAWTAFLATVTGDSLAGDTHGAAE